jgi:sec-independent protein translocase protein TatA
MNVFGIGLPEMVLIFGLALLVFGPKKLPEIGKSLGKAIKGFQDASKEFEAEFKKEADQLQQIVTEPMKATLEPPASLNAAADDAITDATLVEDPVAEEAPESQSAA